MFNTSRTITFAAVVALVCAGAAQAQAAPEVVTLKAPDGVTLKASYFSAGKPGPAILLLHQCNRDRRVWTNLATRAAASGFHVLALDYRGYGDSEGQRYQDPQEQAPVVAGKWPGDVDAAFAWLTSQPGVDARRVGAAGASCGVNQSAQLARRHPEVKTLVLLSGGINPDAREYIAQSPWMPVLAVASRDDGGSVQQMQWLAGWSKNPATKFVEFKAAGHGTDMFAVEKELEPMILDWFDTHLMNASTTQSTQAAQVPAKPGPTEEFWAALTTGDVARARQIYDATKKSDPKVILFPEAELNQRGYELLQEDKPAEAVEVFRMNVEEYPASANTYDSLADGYLAAGNKVEALRYAEKALEVLETDKEVGDDLRLAIRESAEKKIRELKK